MQHTKATIKASIREGHLKKAVWAALEYAEYCGLTDISNALIALNSRASDHRDKWNSGQVSYEDHARAYAQLTHAATQWADRLPEVPVASKKGRKKKFLTEEALKKKLFYRLLTVKILVLGWLTYLYTSGGYTSDQFKGTATLLATTLAAYVAVILTSYLDQHRAGVAPPRYMSGPLVTFSKWLVPVYGGLLLLFITLKTTGAISFTGLNAWLALVETVIGGYIGKIVNTLFKKNE